MIEGEKKITKNGGTANTVEQLGVRIEFLLPLQMSDLIFQCRDVVDCVVTQ